MPGHSPYSRSNIKEVNSRTSSRTTTPVDKVDSIEKCAIKVPLSYPKLKYKSDFLRKLRKSHLSNDVARLRKLILSEDPNDSVECIFQIPPPKPDEKPINRRIGLSGFPKSSDWKPEIDLQQVQIWEEAAARLTVKYEIFKNINSENVGTGKGRASRHTPTPELIEETQTDGISLKPRYGPQDFSAGSSAKLKSRENRDPTSNTSKSRGLVGSGRMVNRDYDEDNRSNGKQSNNRERQSRYADRTSDNWRSRDNDQNQRSDEMSSRGGRDSGDTRTSRNGHQPGDRRYNRHHHDNRSQPAWALDDIDSPTAVFELKGDDVIERLRKERHEQIEQQKPKEQKSSRVKRDAKDEPIISQFSPPGGTQELSPHMSDMNDINDIEKLLQDDGDTRGDQIFNIQFDGLMHLLDRSKCETKSSKFVEMFEPREKEDSSSELPEFNICITSDQIHDPHAESPNMSHMVENLISFDDDGLLSPVLRTNHSATQDILNILRSAERSKTMSSPKNELPQNLSKLLSSVSSTSDRPPLPQEGTRLEELESAYKPANSRSSTNQTIHQSHDTISGKNKKKPNEDDDSAYKKLVSLLKGSGDLKSALPKMPDTEQPPKQATDPPLSQNDEDPIAKFVQKNPNIRAVVSQHNGPQTQNPTNNAPSANRWDTSRITLPSTVEQIDDIMKMREKLRLIKPPEFPSANLYPANLQAFNPVLQSLQSQQQRKIPSPINFGAQPPAGLPVVAPAPIHPGLTAQSTSNLIFNPSQPPPKASFNGAYHPMMLQSAVMNPQTTLLNGPVNPRLAPSPDDGSTLIAQLASGGRVAQPRAPANTFLQSIPTQVLRHSANERVDERVLQNNVDSLQNNHQQLPTNSNLPTKTSRNVILQRIPGIGSDTRFNPDRRVLVSANPILANYHFDTQTSATNTGRDLIPAQFCSSEVDNSHLMSRAMPQRATLVEELEKP